MPTVSPPKNLFTLLTTVLTYKYINMYIQTQFHHKASSKITHIFCFKDGLQTHLSFPSSTSHTHNLVRGRQGLGFRQETASEPPQHNGVGCRRRRKSDVERKKANVWL